MWLLHTSTLDQVLTRWAINLCASINQENVLLATMLLQVALQVDTHSLPLSYTSYLLTLATLKLTWMSKWAHLHGALSSKELGTDVQSFGQRAVRREHKRRRYTGRRRRGGHQTTVKTHHGMLDLQARANTLYSHIQHWRFLSFTATVSTHMLSSQRIASCPTLAS